MSTGYLMTKKQTIKDDGRLLIYYHAPQTATAQQTEVYQEIEAEEQPVALGDKPKNGNGEENAHV
jgi:hypothetical protein